MKDFFSLQASMQEGNGEEFQGEERNGYVEEIDIDGDGISDGIALYEDIDGDGVFDSITTMEDTDGDGLFDTITTMADTDGDGMTDFTMVQMDADGDGSIDGIYAAQAIDIDGDGIADKIITGIDTDGDSVFETTEIMDADELTIYENGMGIDTSAFSQDEMFSFGEYEQFNPSDTDMNQVIGNPVTDEQYWEYQGESGPCAIYAQVMAYEGLTGEEINIDEMIKVATEEGWYSGSGTCIEDMDKILNYLGAETELGYEGNMDDIRECLENGGRVVVAIDGNEVWTGDNDDIFTPNDPNHAVEIIGIDYSTVEPMVIINDSGVYDGHGIMVPESQFMDAWEDSGFAYVETYI